MNNLDILKLAGRNLTRRKSRTALTILSVVIGCVSIILMLSIGFGLQKQEEQYMTATDALNTVTIYSNYYHDPMSNTPIPTKGVLTDKVIREIEQLDHVTGIFPLYSVQSQVRTKKKDVEIWTSIYAFDPKYLPDTAMTIEGNKIKDLAKGEFIRGEMVQAMKGSNSQQGMYETEPLYDFDWSKEKFFIPIGYKDTGMQMSGQTTGKTYEEIKVAMKGSFSQSGFLTPYNIYVNMETAMEVKKIEAELQKNMQGPDGQPTRAPRRNDPILYSELKVRVDEIGSIEGLSQQLRDDYQLEVYSEGEFIQQQQQRMLMTQLILGGIGSIALFVAAIGIANTMLMSIQERTKEIGVMKVIGAQIGDIKKLFLSEAALIGLIGGIIGIGLSYLGSYGINNLVGSMSGGGEAAMMMAPEAAPISISYIPTWLPFLALIFAALIGMIAGYLPAKKATKLSAIDAIRTG